MATANPRVQVTIDPELGAALRAIDPHPVSKSGLIRDLALRGAAAASEERAQHQQAIENLLSISRGEIAYDFEAARAVHAERERSVGGE